MKWHLFNFSESRICPNVPKCGLNTRLDNCEVAWSYTYSIFRKTKFVCPNINRMFRSLDWTHDMIIVKWPLLIWHNRKLCALTNAPPVQSTQTGQWLSTLFHANYSAAQVYVLHPRQFIFALSCRRRSFLKILQSTERKEGYLENFFVYLMMTNVMVKTCLNQKLLKIRIWFRQWRIAKCRKQKLSAGRIFLKAEFVRIFNECSVVWIEHTTW